MAEIEPVATTTIVPGEISRDTGTNDQIRVKFTIHTADGELLAEMFSTAAHAADGTIKSAADIKVALTAAAKAAWLKDGEREVLKLALETELADPIPMPK